MHSWSSGYFFLSINSCTESPSKVCNTISDYLLNQWPLRKHYFFHAIHCNLSLSWSSPSSFVSFFLLLISKQSCDGSYDMEMRASPVKSIYDPAEQLVQLVLPATPNTPISATFLLEKSFHRNAMRLVLECFTFDFRSKQTSRFNAVNITVVGMTFKPMLIQNICRY